MFGRRIPFHQIAFATLVGVVGGVYVYRPMFEPPKKPSYSPEQELEPEPQERRSEAAKTVNRD